MIKKKEVKMVHVPLGVLQLVTGTVPLIYPLKSKYWYLREVMY